MIILANIFYITLSLFFIGLIFLGGCKLWILIDDKYYYKHPILCTILGTLILCLFVGITAGFIGAWAGATNVPAPWILR